MSRELCLVAVLLFAASCRGPERLEPAVDLVEWLQLARVETEPAFLDLGTPRARPYLRAGWSYDERAPGTGETFVWGVGEESSLAFRLLRNRDLDLSFRCQPYARAGAGRQAVTFVVNGREIEAFPLAARLRRYRTRIPSEALRAGENELLLRYGHSQPLEPGDRSARGLAVQWFDLGFEDATEFTPAEPRALAEGGGFFLPWGVRLDYYLLAPEGGVFEVEKLGYRGGRGGRLEVLFETESGGELALASLERSGSARRTPLPGEGERIARLSLQAVPESGSVSESEGLVLQGPRILAPPPAVEEVSTASTEPSRPNILIYLVDTLRADHLGCYGYPLPVSPSIDRFAAEATLFERSVSQSSWTRASVASLFTGLWPHAHGANRRRETLSEEATTLAEILEAAGYRTAAFASNPNVDSAFGFDQGFDHYEMRMAPAHRVTQAVLDWLEGWNGEAPLFLYVHTQDPHDPYEPPPEYRARFAPDLPKSFPSRPGRRQVATPELVAGLTALYDAEIAFNDHYFGVLLEALRGRGLYEDLLVVFLSDHGEEFQDHGGWKHGATLFGENINTPLIVKFPAGFGAGLRIHSLAQHIDLLPTLLDYLGLEPPTFLEGRSLLRVIEAESGERPASRRERAFTYIHLDGPPRIGVIDGDWKLIQRRVRGKISNMVLYNLRDDPGETRSLAEESPLVLGYLGTLLEEKLRQEGRLEASEAVLDRELEDQLRALGYLH